MSVFTLDYMLVGLHGGCLHYSVLAAHRIFLMAMDAGIDRPPAALVDPARFVLSPHRGRGMRGGVS